MEKEEEMMGGGVREEVGGGEGRRVGETAVSM